jgi:hypothetical protein
VAMAAEAMAEATAEAAALEWAGRVAATAAA